jgi:hypothetical protein
LLESAFADVLRNKFSGSLNSYIPSDFALIKPHDSVDWAQFLPGEVGPLSGKGAIAGRFSTDDLIDAAEDLEFSGGEIGFRTWNNDGTIFPQRWHPAIAIPVDRAKTFVCPPEHVRRLSDDLEQVTRILVVGWRAAEQHFLDMLYERLPKNRPLSLCIVDNGAGAKAGLDNLEAALSDVITFRLELHTDGFSAFVGEGKVLEWLARPLEKF